MTLKNEYKQTTIRLKEEEEGEKSSNSSEIRSLERNQGKGGKQIMPFPLKFAVPKSTSIHRGPQPNQNMKNLLTTKHPQALYLITVNAQSIQ